MNLYDPSKNFKGGRGNVNSNGPSSTFGNSVQGFGSGGQIALNATAEEKSMATALGISVAEYRMSIKAEKEARANPTYSSPARLSGVAVSASSSMPSQEPLELNSVSDCVSAMWSASRTHREKASNLLLKICANIFKNPEEAKFRRIKASKISAKFARVPGCIEFLKHGGFVVTDGFLQLDPEAIPTLEVAQKELQAKIEEDAAELERKRQKVIAQNDGQASLKEYEKRTRAKAKREREIKEEMFEARKKVANRPTKPSVASNWNAKNKPSPKKPISQRPGVPMPPITTIVDVPPDESSEPTRVSGPQPMEQDEPADFADGEGDDLSDVVVVDAAEAVEARVRARVLQIGSAVEDGGDKD